MYYLKCYDGTQEGYKDRKQPGMIKTVLFVWLNAVQ